MLNFFKKSKKEEEHTEKTLCACGCTGQTVSEKPAAGRGVLSVKILGTGCKSCHALYDAAKALCDKKGIAASVEYVTDLQKIMGYGLMSTPAVVVNEKLVSVGRVYTETELELLFKELGILD